MYVPWESWETFLQLNITPDLPVNVLLEKPLISEQNPTNPRTSNLTLVFKEKKSFNLY